MRKRRKINLRNMFRLSVSTGFAILANWFLDLSDWAHRKDEEWFNSMVPINPKEDKGNG